LKVLVEVGVDQPDLEAAAAEGPDALARLVARHLMFPGPRRYSPREVYEKSGVDQETAQSLWRAMGFPLVPEDERAFTDADIEALEVACRLFDRAGMDRTIVLQQARSMGQAAARIAASHQDVIAELIPSDDPAKEATEAVALAEEALPALDRLLVYMYRRHLAAATEQRLLARPGAEGSVSMSVGFADLVGFTALSRELDVRELAALIDRFNAETANVVAQGGGRVIKTIGDEVMLATRDPGSAAVIAMTLLDTVSGVEGLPALRVGVATGTVIAREGDVFGAPVNLASRLVTIAVPGSALVDEATRETLAGDERFRLSALARQHLKGFGHVRSYRLRPAGPAEPTVRRRPRGRSPKR
jgi:adenylate cyclase